MTEYLTPVRWGNKGNNGNNGNKGNKSNKGNQFFISSSTFVSESHDNN